MKAKLKLITVAMLGVGITGMMLAGLSVHAEMPSKTQIPSAMAPWVFETHVKDLGGNG